MFSSGMNYSETEEDQWHSLPWGSPIARLGDSSDRDMATIPRRKPRPYNGAYEAQSTLYADDDVRVKNLRCVWPQCEIFIFNFAGWATTWS